MSNAELAIAVPRKAATIAVLRDGPRGVEVLLVRRHGGSPFMPGATVFPGGKVDPADVRAGEDAAQAFARAAVRELREEAHLQLAADADLACFAHWLTPEIEPRRFDTLFFAALAPQGQEARSDKNETTELCWMRPADALADHEQGGPILLPPPTVHTLQRLVALERAQQQGQGQAQGQGQRQGQAKGQGQAQGQGQGQRQAEGAGHSPARQLLAALAAEGKGPQICPQFLADSPAGPTIVLPWDPLHPQSASFLAEHAAELAQMTAVTQALGRCSVDRFELSAGRFFRRNG